MKRVVLAAATACLLSSSAFALDAIVGAVGHGKTSQGGRDALGNNGQVVYVRNRNDSGPGSLRQCAEEMTGPRICLFAVGGIWQLEKGIVIRNDRVAIYGQTAPGGGVLLTVDPAKWTEGPKTPLLIKGASPTDPVRHVTIQNIRVRNQFGNTVLNIDGVTVENAQRIYLDHVSVTWSTDESFNAYDETGFLTVANSIFGEALEGHSKCMLLGSDAETPQKVTVYRNWCHSNYDRNPDIKYVDGSCIDVAQNIFYNASSGTAFFEIFSGDGKPATPPVAAFGTRASIRNNYFKAGPETPNQSFALTYKPRESPEETPQIYEQGNAVWAPPGKTLTKLYVGPAYPPMVNYLVSTPACSNSVAGAPAAAAYDEVRAEAGAWPRDSVDVRFYNELGARGANGAGSIKSAPGALPTIALGAGYTDTDQDGMPDDWEGVHVGADPDAQHGSGPWTNFDMAMSYLLAGHQDSTGIYKYPKP